MAFKYSATKTNNTEQQDIMFEKQRSDAFLRCLDETMAILNKSTNPHVTPEIRRRYQVIQRDLKRWEHKRIEREGYAWWRKKTA